MKSQVINCKYWNKLLLYTNGGKSLNFRKDKGILWKNENFFAKNEKSIIKIKEKFTFSKLNKVFSCKRAKSLDCTKSTKIRRV